MNNYHLKHWLIVIAGFCSSPILLAADPGDAARSGKAEKTESPYAFSLLPKAFQKHPVLAISVITDLTEEGKRVKPPTREHPTYYYATCSGYHHEGQGVSEKGSVSEEDMTKRVTDALAFNHFLPATAEHPPTLALFFFWGVHSKLDQGDSETGELGPRDVGFHNLLSRAALVGGEKFAKDLAKAIKEQSVSGMPAMSIADPVYRFTNRDDLTRNLMEQVLDDCYYVIVSAYDGAALTRGEKKLLWRTRMSTPAQGVSLAETVSALVASSRPFLGQQMSQASIVGKRIDRDGRVEIGDIKFKGYEESAAEKPSEGKAEKK